MKSWVAGAITLFSLAQNADALRGILPGAACDSSVEAGSLMAGQSVGMVTREQSTAEILEELVGQALAALAARGGQTCHSTQQSALGGQGARG